jgi:phosphatidylserine decarboxylase
MGWPLLLLTVLSAYYVRYVAPVFAVLLGLVVWFFRDPPRRIPQDEGLMVSPADGKIAEITRLEGDEFVGGPAVRIGIFLSIFNVHLNRSPAAVRVLGLRYFPGRFLNAMRPESARENESMWIGLEEEAPPHRRLVVRQIAGAYARRIVCALRPGEVVGRGDKIGMIKLGSRTELILADEPGLRIDVKVGDRVKAGTSVLARYEPKPPGEDHGP